jgi:hypothetical protein
MFPGRFDGDAITAFRQGVAFQLKDATSPLIQVLLGLLARTGGGPGPMFLVQLALWGAGLAAFADALTASGRPRVALATAALALCPLLAFDFFDVQKDALLSALLGALIALLARPLLMRRRITRAEGALAAVLALVAMDARHNAFFALIPLALLAWPVRTPSWRALSRTALAGLVALGAAHVTLDALDHGALHAKRTYFGYSLIVFDLAGISARTGLDASEGRAPDFLAASRRCYSPHEWDAFQSGACMPTGLAAHRLMKTWPGRRDLVSVWAREIAAHPRAYLLHRGRHFGCLISVGCRPNAPIMNAGWWPRPWDAPAMRVSTPARVLGKAAETLWRGPLGFGVLWAGVLLAEAGLCAATLRRRFDPAAYVALATALAGLAYLGSFALVGISDQMRYLHPVIFLAVLAGPLSAAAAADVFRSRRDPD